MHKTGADSDCSIFNCSYACSGAFIEVHHVQPPCAIDHCCCLIWLLHHLACYLHGLPVPPLTAAWVCRALLLAGHPDAPPGLALGKIPHHLMSVSTHLYATQMPKWHSVIQSELIRSLILSGTPQALLTLTPSPASTHLQLQSNPALHSPVGQGDPRRSASNNSSLLLADGKVNWQGVKTASAQSYPVLLHQALTLAVTADWGPADFGACETDSSDSSESSGSEQADDSAAQEAIAAAGHDKILAVAVMAVTFCCDKPTLFKANESRRSLGSLVPVPASEVSLIIAPVRPWKFDSLACMLASHVQPSFLVTKALKPACGTYLCTEMCGLNICS